MTERLKGAGRLASLGPDGRDYIVGFVLIVTQDITGASERFSPPRVEGPYFSLAVDPKGQEIPNGEYTLDASEAIQEILRVRKTGKIWQVIRN